MAFEQRKLSFTLIELLVVISIIMLLLALIYPVLISAKSRSKGIACLGNERSFGTSIHLFASEHDSHIKPSFKETAVFDIDYVYESYVDDAKIFDCPARSDDAGIYLTFNEKIVICQYAVFSPFNYAQAYNLDEGGYSPSNVRLVGEAIPPDFGYHWMDEILCPWDSSAEWRHKNGKGMNVVFGDGSGFLERKIASPIPGKPGYPPYIKVEY